MAQLFKNFIATTDTTGSAVTFLECPTGKTLVTTNITAYNDNASNATQTLHLLDKSESTAYTIVFGDTDGYTITSKNPVTSPPLFTLGTFGALIFASKRSDACASVPSPTIVTGDIWTRGRL